MKAVIISELNKIYKPNLLAISNMNLSVDIGDFFALLGPNGAGKSTTIGILTSLIKKSSGKIYVFGYDLDLDFYLIKNFIGFVPQEFNFNQFETVMEIIINQAGYYGISKSQAIKNVEYYLHKLNLWEKRNIISRNLSGGMKKKLMIIRALIHEPKILIIDEPTSGIDIELRHFLWDFLINLNKNGVTIILSTHYLEEVELLCNKVAIINKGFVLLNTIVKDLFVNAKKQTLICEILNKNINLPTICDFNIYKIGETTLEVVLTENYTLNDLFIFFNKFNIIVISIKNKINRLEELFINIINLDKKKI
ncbi:MAG: ABC transporter ATP-binding protein [Candidatus Azosocius agrarius]|nr:MAG: ABC transporter ATP-binding protein [Gammaproteobacteria bacterium]